MSKPSSDCYGLNCVCLPKIHVEALISTMTVFGDEALVSHYLEEVMRVGHKGQD